MVRVARNPRSVRFPVSLEQQVERWAAANGVAFNKAVVELCARQLAAQDSVAGQAVTRQGAFGSEVVPKFDRQCRNVGSHIEGKVCRFCGGEA